ncbi:MAG: RDD family protein [Rickettsiales bacterium]|jgi:uncharacterized RDD family membrane protein YckC|nr:RDD family protein [Rickettsiales bacterium]
MNIKIVHDRDRDPMYAKPIRRFCAYLVDCVFVALLFISLIYILKFCGINVGFLNEELSLEGGVMKYGSTEDNYRNYFTYLLGVDFLYFIVFLSSKKQATLGNQIFKMMVVHKKNIRLNPINSFIRCLGLLLNSQIYYLGFLTYFFRKDGALLQDIISDTNVINLVKPETIKQDILNS